MLIKNPDWAQRIAKRISTQFCGTVLWLCWVLLTQFSSAFAYGVSADKRPVFAMTMLLVAMSVVYLYSVFLVFRSGANVNTLKTVVALALAMRFVAVFSTPVQELDYYRYLWDGETVLAGPNPFQVTPQQALSAVSTESGIQPVSAFYLFSLRLIPAVPFFVINVVMGLTPISARTFFWVSQMGMLPGTAVYVYAGPSVPNLQTPADTGIFAIFTPGQDDSDSGCLRDAGSISVGRASHYEAIDTQQAIRRAGVRCPISSRFRRAADVSPVMRSLVPETVVSGSPKSLLLIRCLSCSANGSAKENK